MQATSFSRNRGIDVLRGISILTVILLHLNIQVPFKESYLGELLPRFWYSIFFWSGFYGVVIFFVISGYLITNSALKKWGSLPELSVRKFYIFRFARIMPLLLLLMIILSSLHLLGVSGFVLHPEKVSLGRAIFAALTFHFNWLEIQIGYPPGNWDILWSLSIEETFYFCFPIIALFARKEWHFVALISIFFIISPWARVALYPDNELGDRNHLAYIDSIATGCIIALVAHRVKISKTLRSTLMILGWGMVIFIFAFRKMAYQMGLTKTGIYISILSLGLGLIILWMHGRHADGFRKGYLGLRPLEWLGKYSYEIYLSHMFIVIFAVKYFKHLELSGEWIYGLYLIVIVLSYSLGFLISNYFSEPLNAKIRAKWISN